MINYFFILFLYFITVIIYLLLSYFTLLDYYKYEYLILEVAVYDSHLFCAIIVRIIRVELDKFMIGDYLLTHCPFVLKLKLVSFLLFFNPLKEMLSLCYFRLIYLLSKILFICIQKLSVSLILNAFYNTIYLKDEH